jgi:PAS domain-containing protein
MLPGNLNYNVILKADECISAYDAHLNILIWNPSCEKKFGIPAEAAVGKNLFDLFPEIKNDFRVQCLQSAAVAGKSFFFPNMFYSYINSSSLYSQYIRPIKEGNKPVGAINIVRDHEKEERSSIKNYTVFFKSLTV